MFRKIGLSLAQQLPSSQVYILGFHVDTFPENPASNLHFLASFRFTRLSIRRALANYVALRHWLRIRPQLIICGTFELLPAALLYKWTRGAKIIYDVRENYYANIRYTQVFPAWIRLPLATLVRGIERIAYPWIAHYFLAETCYQQELGFVQAKSTIIANKFRKEDVPAPIKSKPEPRIKLIYTGTISEDYGIFEAIALAKTWQKLSASCTLSIVGFCPRPQDWMYLQEINQSCDFIQLVGGNQMVPHDRILLGIQESDLVLLPYRVNQSVARRIPTRLYESLALKKPMLISQNPFWRHFLAQYDFQAAIFTDYQDAHSHEQAYEAFIRTRFYEDISQTEGIYWEEEAEKMMKIINALLPISE